MPQRVPAKKQAEAEITVFDQEEAPEVTDTQVLDFVLRSQFQGSAINHAVRRLRQSHPSPEIEAALEAAVERITG